MQAQSRAGFSGGAMMEAVDGNMTGEDLKTAIPRKFTTGMDGRKIILRDPTGA